MAFFLSPKTQEEKDVSMHISPFNIVAHAGPSEEAFSGRYYVKFQLGLSSQWILFFYTLTVFISFRVLTCTL